MASVKRVVQEQEIDVVGLLYNCWEYIHFESGFFVEISYFYSVDVDMMKK